MAKIVAERLVEHLSASGFVVMRKPPAGGTSLLNYPTAGPYETLDGVGRFFGPPFFIGLWAFLAIDSTAL